MTTLYNVLANWATRDPDRPALIAPHASTLCYRDLRDQLTLTGWQLRELGIGPDDRVIVIGRDDALTAGLIVAVAAHAICVPLSADIISNAEWTGLLRRIAPRAVCLHATLSSVFANPLHPVPILLFEPAPGQPEGESFRLHGSTALAPLPMQPSSPDHCPLMLLTSGSSARPKLVPRTHQAVVLAAQAMARHLDLTPEDRCLNFLPLHHSHGLVSGLLIPLLSGGTVILPGSFDADRFLNWLDEFAPTWYTAPPVYHQTILSITRMNRAAAARHRLRFIRSGSSALASSLAEQLSSEFGVPLFEAYGLTEVPHIASNGPGRYRAGSVGAPVEPRISIRDASGARLANGMTGEIAVRGLTLTDGYFDDPEANARSFRDGWFYTGDLGYLDDDGFLFLVGRAKEQINRGGEKIAPTAIDAALLAHPEVMACAAFAIPHPTLGQDLAAVFVPKPGSGLTPEGLSAFLRHRLAPGHQPRYLMAIEQLPLTASGKPDRQTITERWGANAGLDAIHRPAVTLAPLLHPLSPLQEGMLFETLREPGCGANLLQLAMDVGQSMEMGEIEATLRAHEAVTEAVAILREEASNPCLSAYVTLKASAILDTPSDVLRVWLRSRLPGYMIPTSFTILERLPLTPNGKIDRAALPAPAETDQRAGLEYEAPRTEAEQRLAAIWTEVLGVERIGRHDHFFDLGGHSLLATQLVARIERAFHCRLSLRVVFDTSTLAALAAYIENFQWLRGGANDEQRVEIEL